MSLPLKTISRHTIALSLLASNAAYLQAAENGGSVYPNGAESHHAGEMPPPGLYTMIYQYSYRANRLNDSAGNNTGTPGFKVNVDALVPRMLWVTNRKVLGGDLAMEFVAPLLSVRVAMDGASQRKSGLGDLGWGALLGYHHSERLHSVAGINVYFPTASYREGDLANLSRNYYAFETAYALSYMQTRGLNADFRSGYIFNAPNRSNGYRSGQEFHFDYALGWGLDANWLVGVSGYYRYQTTLDRQGGSSLPNSRTSGLSIGPSIKYSGEHWFATLKLEQETRMKNASQGRALWLRVAFPLDGDHR